MPLRLSQDTFTAVDAFVTATLFAAGDEALEAAQADADAAGLPAISVTPEVDTSRPLPPLPTENEAETPTSVRSVEETQGTQQSVTNETDAID